MEKYWIYLGHGIASLLCDGMILGSFYMMGNKILCTVNASGKDFEPVYTIRQAKALIESNASCAIEIEAGLMRPNNPTNFEIDANMLRKRIDFMKLELTYA